MAGVVLMLCSQEGFETTCTGHSFMAVQWLEVQPEDDEKTRAKKRKMAKSYKSKIRFQKMDAQQRDKQSSWLDFQKGKGTKKKAGFFTGLFLCNACAHRYACSACHDGRSCSCFSTHMLMPRCREEEEQHVFRARGCQCQSGRHWQRSDTNRLQSEVTT